ncbi:hypothetical protein PV08_00752 [Exophiala spinifera]|uniref:Zn(2)-C6 fungal-type domain-containing protein n=1 Tax=Exophiala spinifera TaxID=91928 RepID=A0A0D2A5W9_9EURO|nr:uncharacterized protein PV08_00752 [Exophiala spinifera]KIW20177.1 hypothetical protein PV08_00752 [Exophiala spinifera]
MSDTSGQLPPGATKRPRPVISCLICRRKKLKCDRLRPCQQCIKVGRPTGCIYQPGQEPEPNVAYLQGHPSKRQRFEASFVDITNGNLAIAPRPPQTPTGGVIEDLLARVARIEKAVFPQEGHSDAIQPPATPTRAKIKDDDLDQKIYTPAVTTNLSFQFPDACRFIMDLPNNPTMASLRTNLRTVHLAVERNNHKMLLGQDSKATGYQEVLQLPPLHICERLATLYFDNMEHCFRVLHAPTFMRQLRTLFTDGAGEQACGLGFVPQLVGVLLVGASVGTHEECEIAASTSMLRPMRVLKFMQDFLDKVQPRQQYLLPVLQVKMLKLVCHWSSLGRLDDLIRLNGEILRDGLIMLLNEDPSRRPGISVFEGELRRRLWMTIVEIDLMLCILCRIPCMVPPYTSNPPRNINDDEIYEGIEVLPESRPIEEWTDGLCQHMLSKSFPLRLRACKQMDSTSHISFNDLRVFTQDLEKILQELPSPLRFTYQGDQASKTPPRLLARMELDFSIRRPLMHLYTCFVASSNAADISQEWTDGFLQSCLMITTFQDLFDPRYSEIDVPRPEGYWDFFHNLYRNELVQAILGLCLGIKGLGTATSCDDPAVQGTTPSTTTPGDGSQSRYPGYTRSNLISSVVDTLEPLKLRISHPGANFKDMAYFTIVLTSLLPENPGEPKQASIQRSLQGLVRECLDQLRKDNVPIPLLENHTSRPHDVVGNPSQDAGHSYDSVWCGFPAVDLFEPPEIPNMLGHDDK